MDICISPLIFPFIYIFYLIQLQYSTLLKLAQSGHLDDAPLLMSEYFSQV